MITLFTDSDTDMNPQIAAKYGYKLISMPYTINDQTIYPYKDFEVFDSKTFYGTLRSGVVPYTSALNPEDYKEYFESEFAAGNDILYVHFSRAISGTFDHLDTALAELKVKYPERTCYTIDTRCISIASLAILHEIGQMYVDGKTVAEIMKWAETEVYKYAFYMYADDLKFFRKSGRVKGLTAIVGTILHICPIISIGDDGIMKSIGKEMGRTKSFERLVKYVAELNEDIANHRIIIGHCDSAETAKKFEQRLRDTYGDNLQIDIIDVNPTAGCHCGPGCMGVSFYAKHR